MCGKLESLRSQTELILGILRSRESHYTPFGPTFLFFKIGLDRRSLKSCLGIIVCDSVGNFLMLTQQV